MEHVLLKFYTHESQRLHGRQVWEWLLAQASAMNVGGGSAFRAIAGFGRDRRVREDRFVELAGTITVAVEFVTTPAEAEQLLALVAREGLRLHYVRSNVASGVTGE